MLWLQAAHTPEIIRELMRDAMWNEWVCVCGLALDGVAGEAAIAISTLHYLVVPGWSEDHGRYLAFMEALLVEALA
ncbi:hypothetical protein [Kitasatospora indigofera]|uniref:hypothetical protein n=1 Tax=Kitasatospora indigofera TaxID=67307 RepID=UPI0036ACDFBE